MLRKGVVGLVAAALGMLVGGGVATAQDTTVPAPPQASATVTGLPTVSGSLEDETIRVLIENCEVGTATITIDGIEVATVTITADATASAVDAAATGEVVVAIPDGAEPPYDVDVTCSNGVASTVVNLPTTQVPDTDDEAQAPGAGGGGADDGEGSLPLTGGGSTLVPLARGAAVAVAAGALMVLATRNRRETAAV